jgi:hypothetical protein
MEFPHSSGLPCCRACRAKDAVLGGAAMARLPNPELPNPELPNPELTRPVLFRMRRLMTVAAITALAIRASSTGQEGGSHGVSALRPTATDA